MTRWRTPFLVGVFVLLSTSAALADGPPVEQQIRQLWTLIAAILILLMQLGFLLLEAGQVRSKNSINVAQKNLMDFVLSAMLFGILGSTLMFGESLGGWIGWSSEKLWFRTTETWDAPSLLVQMMFAGTAATVLSGAVAERMTMTGYLIAVSMIALVLYPIVGHWTWGGQFTGSTEPWLEKMGFMDFAGGTVVHATGAWVALAAIIEIGPRRNKFDADGKPQVLQGHSPVLASAGCLVLWVGWLGFNGASLAPGDPLLAQTLVNTIVAGAAGGAVALLIGRIGSGILRPEVTINGVLGGLVGVTAGANVFTAFDAILVGGAAGVVVWLVTRLLERRLHLDDPLGAIAVHGAAGTLGTLLIPVLADPLTLVAGARWSQFVIQSVGVVSVFAFAFCSSRVLFRVAAWVVGRGPGGRSPFRVPEQAEIDGLNVYEHGATMGLTSIQQAMAAFDVTGASDLAKLELSPDDDAYELSLEFNRVVRHLQDTHTKELERQTAKMVERDAIAQEISDLIAAMSRGEVDTRLELSGKTGFVRDMANNVNRLCDVTAERFTQIQNALRSAADGDFDVRFEGTYTGAMAHIQADVNRTLAQLGDAFKAVEDIVGRAAKGDFSSRIDLTEKSGSFARLCEGINQICEISQSGLSDLTGLLARVAEGDMSAKTTRSYDGQFAKIMASMEETTQRMSDLLCGISAGATRVHAIGTKVSENADAIQSASQSQSSTLTQLGSVLSDIETTSRSYVDRTSQARETCDLAQTRACEGVEMANDAVTGMSEIATAAREIAGTVGLIQGIARQTHILSINASVEAARSATDNAGFRVVAEEVRTLAAQTNDAALRITEKADLVQRVVTNQEQLVGTIAGKLDSMRDVFSGTAALVEELALSGQREADRLTEATVTLAKVGESALRNADLSVNNRAQVGELQASSTQMAQALSIFRTADGTPLKSAA